MLQRLNKICQTIMHYLKLVLQDKLQNKDKIF